MRFTVVACTRTTTSPLAGTGAGTSSKRTTSGPPYSVRTAARTFSVWPRASSTWETPVRSLGAYSAQTGALRPATWRSCNGFSGQIVPGARRRKPRRRAPHLGGSGCGAPGRSPIHGRSSRCRRRLLPPRATADTTSPTTTSTSPTPRRRAAPRRRSRGRARWCRHHRPRRHPGSRPVQPGPARDGRSIADGQRQVGDWLAPPLPGATVEGAAYWQVQDDAARIWELTVQPRPKIKRGQAVQVVVEYGGTTFGPRTSKGRSTGG